jgi:hypothetical protein
MRKPPAATGTPHFSQRPAGARAPHPTQVDRLWVLAAIARYSTAIEEPPMLIAAPFVAFLLAADVAPCEYKPPKEPPAFSVERLEGAKVQYSQNPKWFNCAKKAGGTVEIIFTIDGQDQPPKKLTSYGENESIYRKQICASGPGPKKVQARLVGKGPLEQMTWSSPEGEVYCERCEYRGDDNMFALHTAQGTPMNPRGMYTIEGTLDPEWFECAKEGSTLELWIYATQTRVEAQESTEPTHKIRGLESKHYKKSFKRKPICKEDAKWIGYELHGTGELSRLNGMGRGVTESDCGR